MQGVVGVSQKEPTVLGKQHISDIVILSNILKSKMSLSDGPFEGNICAECLEMARVQCCWSRVCENVSDRRCGWIFLRGLSLYLIYAGSFVHCHTLLSSWLTYVSSQTHYHTQGSSAGLYQAWELGKDLVD